MAKKATPEQKREIADVYRLNMERGMSQAQAIQEIARNTGRSIDGIRQILKKEGIDLVPSRQSIRVFENAQDDGDILGLDHLDELPKQDGPARVAERRRVETDEALPIWKPAGCIHCSWMNGQVYKFCDTCADGKLGGYGSLRPASVQMHEIGGFAKQVETSEDYEIKASTVKTFDKFNEAEHYQLTKPERWLILPDTQIPYHDQKSLDVVLKYAAEIYWDGVIQLGDFMDWDFISRWTRENARKIEGQRFVEEYIHGNAVLDQIQESVRKQNPNAHFVVIEGNHDWRIENVVNQTPALEGLIEMEQNLRFDERKITYWRYWSHRKPFIVGKAWFIHGEYLGSHHAKKTAESFHRNVFYGHTHDVMSYTKTTAWGDSIMCSSLGTLSVLDLEYMGHRPSNWQQAFAEFFFQPNGNFNHYVTNIVENQFTAINGRQYK